MYEKEIQDRLLKLGENYLWKKEDEFTDQDTRAVMSELSQLVSLVRSSRRLGYEGIEWVVNDLGELGIKVGETFAFLYKGESYHGGRKWRHVFKREFGEVCRPWDTIEMKTLGSIQSRPGLRMPEDYQGFLGEEIEDLRHLPWSD